MSDALREEGSGGVICPFCSHNLTQVRDSRPADQGRAIRRRRLCVGCEARFTTYERVQLREMTVIKRGGRRQTFDRDKLARSINLAVVKRALAPDTIDLLLSRLVRVLESNGETEVTSAVIGETVLRHLRNVDAVAYVRYASVYRDFRTAEDFTAFLAEHEFS